MKAFMKTHGGCAERVAYERRPGAWAGLLREHDDANLRAFDLDSP